ncbi:MAG: hypothetical protein AAGI38_23555 [Bacteroidota bacterium]
MPAHILLSTAKPDRPTFHYYHLPQTLLNIKVYQEGFPPDATYRVETAFVVHPDPDHRYYLVYQNRGNTHDKLKINFANGYLQSIESTRIDKTLDIIEDIVDLAKDAATGGVVDRSVDGPLLDRTVDPFDEEVIAELVKEIQGVIPDFSLSFGSTRKSDIPDSTLDLSKPQGGILCRARELCKLTYTLDGSPVEVLAYVPHKKLVHLVEIPHAKFSESKVNITFDEYGYPTLIDVDQPSWMENFSQKVSGLLRGIFELPTSLLQFRVNLTDRRVETLEQMEQTKARMKVLEEKVKKQEAASEEQKP